MTRRILLSFFVLAALTSLRTIPVHAADNPPDDFVKMIVRLIGDSDREFRAAGLEQVRSAAKGPAATKIFADQLPKLDAGGQVALLHALADRGDVSARAHVLDLLNSSQNDAVRSAAFSALGTLGGPDELPLLIKTLSATSSNEQSAARKSLVQLGGDAISSSLAAESRNASPSVRTALFDVLATRRASQVSSIFIDASLDENAQVRAAAMAALGQIGQPDQIGAMLPGVLKAQKGGERDNAERQVVQVCSRIENEDQRGVRLIEALNKVPVTERDELLPLVGRVGGKKLIGFVADIATSTDASRRRIGIDALSKWPDASVADKLLEIVNKASDLAERHQAFQGFVKIASTRDNRSDKQRLERMKDAMKAAKTPEEQSFVINRTRTAYDVDALRFVLPYVDQPEFAQVACETIVEIAHHREVRDPNKTEFHKALDKVIETAKDPVVVDRAKRYQRGDTWERPKKS